MKNTFYIISFIALFFFGCNNNAVYQNNKEIDNGVWNVNEVKKFDVEISDTLSFHNFYIYIRNSTDYSYSNVYFFINTMFPGGGLSRDTVECFLADINGNWLGKGMGQYKNNTILFKRNVRFPKKGTYSFEFEQAMREKDLQGIYEVGMKIEITE